MPTLITIPFSHFCEKARWSLDHAGVAYREEGHVPAAHRRAVRRVRGKGSVPALVLDDGAVLDDSPLIVRWADERAPERGLLPPAGATRDEALALEHHLDVDLAPHVRRFAYFHLLPDRALTMRLFEVGTPAGEVALAAWLFPLLRGLMRRGMKIDEPRALRSRDAVRRVFDEVTGRLADGRPFLLGDRPRAVDITFAAFVSPLLAPPEHPLRRLPLEDLPGPYRDEARSLGETPAGRFALRMYRDHRRA